MFRNRTSLGIFIDKSKKKKNKASEMKAFKEFIEMHFIFRIVNAWRHRYCIEILMFDDEQFGFNIY